MGRAKEGEGGGRRGVGRFWEDAYLLEAEREI